MRCSRSILLNFQQFKSFIINTYDQKPQLQPVFFAFTCPLGDPQAEIAMPAQTIIKTQMLMRFNPRFTTIFCIKHKYTKSNINPLKPMS